MNFSMYRLMKQAMMSSLAWFFIAQLSAAENRYISDQLQVPLRSGPTLEYRITGYVESGAKVSVIARSEDSPFSRIRTPSGKEGWLENAQLMEHPAAKEALVQAEQTIKQLQENYAAEVGGMKESVGQAMDMKNQNQQLRKQVTELQTELQNAQQKTLLLQERSDRDAFIAGAIVLCVGLGFGLLLPKLKLGKRRDDWF